MLAGILVGLLGVRGVHDDAGPEVLCDDARDLCLEMFHELTAALLLGTLRDAWLGPVDAEEVHEVDARREVEAAEMREDDRVEGVVEGAAGLSIFVSLRVVSREEHLVDIVVAVGLGHGVDDGDVVHLDFLGASEVDDGDVARVERPGASRWGLCWGPRAAERDLRRRGRGRERWWRLRRSRRKSRRGAW